jgi:hypothetical protein
MFTNTFSVVFSEQVTCPWRRKSKRGGRGARERVGAGAGALLSGRRGPLPRARGKA